MSKELADYIVENFTERCDGYSPGCANCVAWRAYDNLMASGPLTDEEVMLAMHWLDRYAAGFDGYPQFDRIVNRRKAGKAMGMV